MTLRDSGATNERKSVPSNASGPISSSLEFLESTRAHNLVQPANAYILISRTFRGIFIARRPEDSKLEVPIVSSRFPRTTRFSLSAPLNALSNVSVLVFGNVNSHALAGPRTIYFNSLLASIPETATMKRLASPFGVHTQTPFRSSMYSTLRQRRTKKTNFAV